MRPWCIHFGRERNAQKNENLMIKRQQAAANNIICSSTFFFFFPKNQPTKKKEKGKKLEKLLPLYPVYVLVSHQGRFGQPRTNWRRGRLHKAGTTRDRYASFTCVLLRSCRDVRRPRHLPNAKTAAISQPDTDGTTKKRISYFGDPQTGEVSY